MGMGYAPPGGGGGSYDPLGSASAAQTAAVQRANHTGTQTQSTVTGLVTDLAALQPLDADLTAIAAVASQTSFGRAFLAAVDATDVRSTLGLGTAATTAATAYATTAQGATADAALPAAGAVTPTSTTTLTNKRVTKRVTSVTSSATPTINTDNCDAVTITAQAVAITSMTTNLSGTPTDFQQLLIRIKDDGTARAIAWGASFAAHGGTLPTTTVAGKIMTIGFIHNGSVWGCTAVATEA